MLMFLNNLNMGGGGASGGDTSPSGNEITIGIMGVGVAGRVRHMRVGIAIGTIGGLLWLGTQLLQAAG